MKEVRTMVGTEGNADYVVVNEYGDGRYELGMKALMAVVPGLGIPMVGLRVRGALRPMDGAAAVDMSKGKETVLALPKWLADKWEKMDENRVSLNMVKPVAAHSFEALFPAAQTQLEEFLELFEQNEILTDENKEIVKSFLREQIEAYRDKWAEAAGEQEAEKPKKPASVTSIDKGKKGKKKED